MKNSGLRFGAVTTPLDLADSFNWPRKGKGKPWWKALHKEAQRVYRGKHVSWGIPFQFGRGNLRRMILLASDEAPVTVPAGSQADYVCILHLWKWGFPTPVRREDLPLGTPVAQYELLYADGTRHVLPVRARFEINSPYDQKSNYTFGVHLAVPLDKGVWLDPTGPIPAPKKNFHSAWGNQQCGFQHHGHLWWDRPMLYAMPNPHPQKRIQSILLRGLMESPVIVAAVTLYQGSAHPLNHLPTRSYRVRAGKAAAKIARAEVDMGHLIRIAPCDEDKTAAWLKADDAGLNVLDWANKKGDTFLEVTGAPDATVSVELDSPKRQNHRFSLGEAFHTGESRDGGTVLESLGAKRTWVNVRVIDSSTGRPTAARIHFAGPRGDYLPPWGHHGQINTNFFEEYGADVRTNGRNYAYVSGEFAIDLPVGEVYVELSKGFEYQPRRQRITVRPGQKTLDLRLDRWADWRSRGWVTADTHVHFITPHTAWLEGQAEGVNVVNVLSAKWSRMFSSIPELVGRPGVEGNDTVVYVGYENTDHMMAHMSLLGGPVQSGCPVHGGLGDPRMYAMSAWAAKHRAEGGFVVRPHFPYFGATEDPVAILHGLVDALEVIGFSSDLTYATEEWYRYLNCGYRVAVAGGTDKMSAAQALGAMRTYARLADDAPLTFDRWGRAVRDGRTFATNGPLVDIEVEGAAIGDTIRLPAGGGNLHVRARAQSAWPLGALEIVCNGKVVASTTSGAMLPSAEACLEAHGHASKDRSMAPKGARELTLSERVNVPRTGWLAARCRGLQGHRAEFHLAHTSPVYVQCGRSRAYDGPALEHMLSMVDGGIESLQTLSTIYDQKTQRVNLRYFEETRRELMERLRAGK